MVEAGKTYWHPERLVPASVGAVLFIDLGTDWVNLERALAESKSAVISWCEIGLEERPWPIWGRMLEPDRRESMEANLGLSPVRSVSLGIDCQSKCADFSESNTFWTSQFAHMQRLYSVICLSCTSTLRYQRSVSRIQGHLPGLASSNDNLHGLRNTSRSVHSLECPDSQAYSRLCRTRPAPCQTIRHKSPRPS